MIAVKFKEVEGNMKVRILLASALLFGAVSSAEAEITKGFYAGASLIGAKQKAKDMDDSIHPQADQFTKHKDHRSYVTGSVAGGYQFDDIFRVELEYVIPKKNDFTASVGDDFSSHKIKGQRLMVNAYASYPVNETFSVYGSAGLGYARLKSTGTLGSFGNYDSHSNNNFAWSVGAGVSFKPINNTYVDLGIRHVDMGKARTGMSQLGGNNGQLRAKVATNEVTLGVRYMLGEWYTEDGNAPTENIYADHITPELKESFEKTDYETGSFRESHAQQPLKKADGTSVPREVIFVDWRAAPY